MVVGANVRGSASFSIEREEPWEREDGEAIGPQEREISRAVRRGCRSGV